MGPVRIPVLYTPLLEIIPFCQSSCFTFNGFVENADIIFFVLYVTGDLSYAEINGEEKLFLQRRR